MVTQFNKKDLVSFGNFLLGPKNKDRNILIAAEVTHADVENWKESQSKITKVRAKFECHHIGIGDEKFGQESDTINMQVVIDGSPENKEFCKLTPFGQLSLGIDKDCEALKLFEVDAEYYVDFTKVVK